MTQSNPSIMPQLRRHKALDQAYVRLNRQQVYLGKWGAEETLQRYLQTVAAWIQAGRELPVTPDVITVEELLHRFWRWAEEYYRDPDGNPTGEVSSLRCTARVWRNLYGGTRVVDFGPLALKALRQHMIEIRWTRKGINRQIQRIRRIVAWGVENELVAPGVYHALQSVAGLKQGRTEAREKPPIRGIATEDIEAVKTRVSRQVAAMIDVQLLTGCRPGELVNMCAVEFDTEGPVWVYRPLRHKTAYRGKVREIAIGPRAQLVLRPFMLRPTNKPLFSPKEAEAERRAQQHEARKTPMSCGNRPGTNRKEKPTTEPGERYTVASYRRCIERACIEAGIPVWAPNRLRHTAATEIRRRFGLESAQAVLGHSKADTSEIYAQLGREKAVDVAMLYG